MSPPRKSCLRTRIPSAAGRFRFAIGRLKAQRPVAPLRWSKGLTAAAADHVRDQGPIGGLEHRGTDNSDPARRASRYGRWIQGVAENIAWGQGKHGSPAAIVAAWMASPPHRETILTEGMRDVGIGVRPGKPGDRQSSAASYTADFGYRN